MCSCSARCPRRASPTSRALAARGRRHRAQRLHNPYEDNGIKFFRHDGYKLDDEIEKRIEQLVFGGEIANIRPTAGKIGQARRIDDALGRYVEHAKASFPKGLTLEGIRIAVDAGNGAAYKSTPWILRELARDVLGLSRQAGRPEHQREVRQHVSGGDFAAHQESGAHIGISHDGDADRGAASATKSGRSGGRRRHPRDCSGGPPAPRALAKDTLVATIMSNFGLDDTLAEHRARVLRTKVGDRHVIEAMLREDLNVGGEQSGHMIFRDYSTTGDGIVSALQILRIMAESGKPLSELKRCLRKYPQAQRNLKVREKTPLEQLSRSTRSSPRRRPH